MQVNIEGLDALIENKVAEAVARHLNKTWYSAPEAAEYLGLSVATIYDYVQDGKLPRHGEAGTKLRFRRKDLDAFAETRR
jgi:excisionase family DNA binding protein